MATTAQITYCKTYMRVDGSDEDAFIGTLCDAALGYLQKAGCQRGTDGTPQAAQFDLCMAALTLHWYDHRDSVGTETAIPIGAQHIITQLKLAKAPS